jgi:hypothetical protein
MAKPTLATVFTAQDFMSPQIKKMQDSVSRMSDKIQEVNKKASGSFLNLKNAAIVTLGVMAIGKIKSFAEEFANTGDEIAKTSSRLGMTSVELQRLRYAMGQQGVSSETLTQSFETLNKNLGLLQTGQGALFSKLKKNNPEMLNQIRNTKSNSEAFSLLMDAMDKTTDATEKAALSTIAFGGAGQMMILASKGGSKTINDLGNKMEKFGVISNEDAMKAEALNDSIDNLNKAFGGLVNQGYVPVLQKMEPLITKMADYISENKKFIALGIEKVIDVISKAFDILKIGMDTGLIPVIIGMKLAFEAAKLAIIAQTAVTTAYTVIQSVLSVGLIATTKLIIAQNAAWLASPIGLVIVSVAALASVFYLLYKNIETIDGWILTLYTKFTEMNIVLKILIGYLALTGIVALVAFAPITATVVGIMIAIYALVKAYQYLKNKISGEPIETEIKEPELPTLPGIQRPEPIPGMEAIDRKNMQTANSGMLMNQTINRNNNSNVTVDFRNLPQNANITQKGQAPNININRGMNIDPFILFGGGFK